MVRLMTFYVDRFEGELAVVQREDGVPGVIARKDLPSAAREGSVLVFEDGAYRLDLPGERARRRTLHGRLNELMKRKKS